MITHDLQQGSPEWLAFRKAHFPASDAPAMLGESPYKTRQALLKEYATGISEEIGASTQRRFDAGHRFEALDRPNAEELIGTELYPCVGSDGKLSASFDGLTMMEDVCFEHKSLNDSIRSCVDVSNLPEHYRIQMEQQLLVSGAEKCLFRATSWDAKDQLIEYVTFLYCPNLDLRQRIINGWTQFEKDVANYQHVQIEEKPAAKAVIDLPALVLQARGELVSSNMAAFGIALKEHLAESRALVYTTDQEFSDAESRAKLYRETCKKLEMAKDQMLAQTVSIDEAFRLIDTWHEDLRTTALQIEKDCKANKEAKQVAMINAGKIEFTAYVAVLEAGIAPIRLQYTIPNFAEAIKGKRLFTAMHDAVQTALANAKIELHRVTSEIAANLNWINVSYPEHMFLFNDLQTIVYKSAEDFRLLARTRVEDHKKAEDAKIEAAKAAAAAQAVAEERARAEAARVIEDQRAKAEAEALAVQNNPPPVVAQVQPEIAPVAPATGPAPAKAWPFPKPVAAPTLRLGQISDRLGFNLNAEFLRSLGFEHSAKDKAALLYHETQFNEICAALISHISAAMQSKAA